MTLRRYGLVVDEDGELLGEARAIQREVGAEKRTIEIVRLLRQLADHPAAPPGRALYVNEAADEIARHYGIRA